MQDRDPRTPDSPKATERPTAPSAPTSGEEVCLALADRHYELETAVLWRHSELLRRALVLACDDGWTDGEAAFDQYVEKAAEEPEAKADIETLSRQLVVRMDDDLRAWLEADAKANERNLSQTVRFRLREALGLPPGGAL